MKTSGIEREVTIGDCRLIQGDCLAVLPGFDRESIGAVVTDPPYSSGGMMRSDRAMPTSTKYSGWSANEDGSSKQPEAEYPEFTGDNKDQRAYLHWSSVWLSFAQTASKSGAILCVFTDWRQLPITTDAIQGGNWVWRGVCVWDKGIGRPVQGRFRNHMEYVCWGSNGPMPDPSAVYPSALCRATPPGATEREHRTEKPVEVIEHLLIICEHQTTVLDPFMGSGTTGVACVRTGRKFVGIEKDPGYFDIACRRIREAYDAQALFGGIK